MKRGIIWLVLLISFSSFSCGQGSSLTSSAASLYKISVLPSTAKVSLNGTAKFTAYGYNSGGSSVSFTPTWSVTGEIGKITQSGTTTTFTAKASGEGKVIASYNSISNSVSVTVTKSNLASITVDPQTAGLIAGKTRQFTAKGKDADGTTVEIIPTWSVSGNIGIIDDKGLFFASTEGSGKVIANVGGISGEAAVSVVKGL